MLFFSKNLNHIRDPFKSNGKMRSWEDSTEKLGLDDKKNYGRQIIHAIPRVWRQMFIECGDNTSDLIINEHCLIKKHQICCLEKLNRELYNMQLILHLEKPTTQAYFENARIYIYLT